jgi:hypothetical protein
MEEIMKEKKTMGKKKVAPARGASAKKDRPGYPASPAGEDIFQKAKQETEIDPQDLTEVKDENESSGTKNEKEFDEDMSGGDLDVPGSELDDDMEAVGSEDEENNAWSLGGDSHDD